MRSVIQQVAAYGSGADEYRAARSRSVRRHHRLSRLSAGRAIAELRGARMVLTAAERVRRGDGWRTAPSRCDGAMVRAARDRCERIEREITVIYAGRWLV